MQLVEEQRFQKIVFSGRPIVMGAANKSFRRLLVGGVSALSFFSTCGAVSGSLNAAPAPSMRFPAEQERADLSFEAALWRSEFQRAGQKQSPADATETSETAPGANPTDEVFSGLTAAEDFFENEALFSSYASSIDRSVHHSSTQSITDWESAVCNADGVQGRKTTAGPSAVTAVVAVVGAVVVFGAYFKSSGR